MRQGVLPFQYQQENGSPGMTALSGLMTYLELIHVSGLRSSVERHVGLRERGQGWTDNQIVNSLMLLNPVSSTGQALAGGESVSDLDVLDKDAGLCKLIREIESCGMGGKERRVMEGGMACGASAERTVGVCGVPLPGEVPRRGRGGEAGSSHGIHTRSQRSAEGAGEGQRRPRGLRAEPFASAGGHAGPRIEYGASYGRDIGGDAQAGCALQLQEVPSVPAADDPVWGYGAGSTGQRPI